MTRAIILLYYQPLNLLRSDSIKNLIPGVINKWNRSKIEVGNFTKHFGLMGLEAFWDERYIDIHPLKTEQFDLTQQLSFAP